jgi:hypothetical protein
MEHVKHLVVLLAVVGVSEVVVVGVVLVMHLWHPLFVLGVYLPHAVTV